MLNKIIDKNQIKQENENKSEGFNILMLGRPGVGKSTIVNLLSNSKRSMEGKGINMTKYIARYVIKNILNDHLIKKRNQIHLILKWKISNSNIFLFTFCPDKEFSHGLKNYYTNKKYFCSMK